MSHGIENALLAPTAILRLPVSASLPVMRNRIVPNVLVNFSPRDAHLAPDQSLVRRATLLVLV